MAMRTSARKYEREELVAYIHGISPEGDVAHILVHKRGANVRFSGMLGDHKVAASNNGDLEMWVSEAETVWGLHAAFGVLRGWATTAEVLEKMEHLKVEAAEKKKELGLQLTEEPQVGFTDAA
jgi:hypothetical protein